MVAVGEETGNLETVLVQLADYYDREVNFTVASFTKLLEPAVMLVLAVVVLFILDLCLSAHDADGDSDLGGWGYGQESSWALILMPWVSGSRSSAQRPQQ